MAERRSGLHGLLPDLLDPGYARAAARRGGAPPAGRGQPVALVLGAVLVGLVLGVAAADAAARAPGAEQARRGLAEDVREARDRTEELAGESTALAERLRRARADALSGTEQGERTLAGVRELELAAGAVAVTGPGLRITVADAGDGETERSILDRDLQVLVNSVWASGAEAMALGGVRLHPRATVRQAGGAVLVDNRPVAQPYVLEAIGDPATLHTRLVETEGYGRFASFTQLYGTRFAVETVDGADALSLPPGSPAEPEHARKEGG